MGCRVVQAFRPAVAAAAFILVAAMAIARAQDTSTDKGEQVQNRACLNCHDLRPIQTAAYDQAGWTMVIDSMVQKGAEVKPAEVPALVEYLFRRHGPLPAGPGKEILLNACTLCHDLGRVRAHTVSRDEWEETLSAMLNEGAMLSDQDFAVVLNYLARNFRGQ